MLISWRHLFAIALGLLLFTSPSFAGNLVFEAEEEEEIIIVEENESHAIEFDLALLAPEVAIDATLFLDLRDEDAPGEKALISVEDFIGMWSTGNDGADPGSPAPGFSSNALGAEVLTTINRDLVLQVELRSEVGNFSYHGATLTLTTPEVPEPTSAALLLIGLAALCTQLRRPA